MIAIRKRATNHHPSFLMIEIIHFFPSIYNNSPLLKYEVRISLGTCLYVGRSVVLCILKFPHFFYWLPSPWNDTCWTSCLGIAFYYSWISKKNYENANKDEFFHSVWVNMVRILRLHCGISTLSLFLFALFNL